MGGLGVFEMEILIFEFFVGVLVCGCVLVGCVGFGDLEVLFELVVGGVLSI